jgi:hypothetical protein
MSLEQKHVKSETKNGEASRLVVSRVPQHDSWPGKIIFGHDLNLTSRLCRKTSMIVVLSPRAHFFFDLDEFL